MGTRRKARECALQLLYQLEFDVASFEESLGLFWEDFLENTSVRDFTNTLVRGVYQKKPEIDQFIQSCSTNWKLERMTIVDRNILRLATYELLYVEEIPHKVSLNEAIEIAKKFGTEDSSSFINGILDRIASVSAQK